MFVVTVTFVVKPEARAVFLPLMMENARLSLKLETGCRRFDVCEAPDAPHEIFLYEIYDDEAAFDAHKTMPHYLDFTETTAPLIANKSVRTFTLIDERNKQ